MSVVRGFVYKINRIGPRIYIYVTECILSTCSGHYPSTFLSGFFSFLIG